LSLEELTSLRRLKAGESAGIVPTAHRARFLTEGWVEKKFGGYVLTALGRYQLDMRLKDSELVLLAHRWRHRAQAMRIVAEAGTVGQIEKLVVIAAQWEALARQAEHLEQLEREEPLLG